MDKADKRCELLFLPQLRHRCVLLRGDDGAGGREEDRPLETNSVSTVTSACGLNDPEERGLMVHVPCWDCNGMY